MPLTSNTASGSALIARAGATDVGVFSMAGGATRTGLPITVLGLPNIALFASQNGGAGPGGVIVTATVQASMRPGAPGVSDVWFTIASAVLAPGAPDIVIGPSSSSRP
jgi:hypothetical protein